MAIGQCIGNLPLKRFKKKIGFSDFCEHLFVFIEYNMELRHLKTWPEKVGVKYNILLRQPQELSFAIKSIT